VVVYATDNEPGAPDFDRNVRKLAEGADVFIYDAQFTPYEYANQRRGWGHSTWREAVNIANEAGVKQLVLFHHDPDHSDNFVDTIFSEAEKFFPTVRAAWEGWEIDLLRNRHQPPTAAFERRAGNREPLQVPLVVQGRLKDGSPFLEQTVLENL